jgi:hypothetical protein
MSTLLTALKRLVYAVSKTTPDTTLGVDRAFSVWRGQEPLQDADPARRFRSFLWEVLSGGPGSELDNSETAYGAVELQLLVGYPEQLQLPGDTDGVGVSGLVAADAPRLNSMIARAGVFAAITPGHLAYDAAVGNLPAIDAALEPELQGWTFDRRVLRMRYRFELGEADYEV